MNEQLESIPFQSAVLTKSRPSDLAGDGQRATNNRVGYLPKSPNSSKPPKRDDEEDDGYFRRNRVALAIGALVVGGLAWGYFHMPSGESAPVKKKETVVMIQIPPPPPPPPKKDIPPPKVEKKVETTPVEKPVEKPKPADEPPKGLGTSVKGSGPGSGLGDGRGLQGVIGGTGNGDGRGGLAKAYGGKAGAKIAEALRNHRKTRTASLNVKVKIWPDSTGRITQAELVGTTGDSVMDDTIKKEILTGLQIQEPPPAGIHMPIVLALNARRPGQ